MTTFTTEDRELIENEPIPFYGFFHISDPSSKDSTPLLHPVLKKIQLDYRVDDSSEDLED